MCLLCVHPDRLLVSAQSGFPSPHTNSSTELQQDVSGPLWPTEIWETVPCDAGPAWWIHSQHQIQRTPTYPYDASRSVYSVWRGSSSATEKERSEEDNKTDSSSLWRRLQSWQVQPLLEEEITSLYVLFVASICPYAYSVSYWIVCMPRKIFFQKIKLWDTETQTNVIFNGRMSDWIPHIAGGTLLCVLLILWGYFSRDLNNNKVGNCNSI